MAGDDALGDRGAAGDQYVQVVGEDGWGAACGGLSRLDVAWYYGLTFSFVFLRRLRLCL